MALKFDFFLAAVLHFVGDLAEVFAATNIFKLVAKKSLVENHLS